MDPLKFSISAQALCWCRDEMTYTSFQGAQSPALGPQGPAAWGEPQLPSASLIRQLVLIVLHMCTPLSHHLQCICLLAGAWGVLSVHINIL